MKFLDEYWEDGISSDLIKSNNQIIKIIAFSNICYCIQVLIEVNIASNVVISVVLQDRLPINYLIGLYCEIKQLKACKSMFMVTVYTNSNNKSLYDSYLKDLCHYTLWLCEHPKWKTFLY